ncbi:MAG: DUF1801 domain-containing protein [Thermoplasmata archaeon]|nr:DUF1801 domain-containing protein [Thermoplasmata archaeon]
MAPSKGVRSPEVDEYIAGAPAAARGKLETIRKAIWAVAPDSTEVISYRIPGFSYRGYRYKGMFVWYALQSGHLGIYLRPPTIRNHRAELRGYTTTKSAVHLPLDDPVPVKLLQKLVRASLGIMMERG